MEQSLFLLAENDMGCELQHHGILGQRWGVRRYQNADGSLTPAGKRHLAEISDNGKGLNEKGMKLIRGDKQATITKGTTLYRVSSNKSDLNGDKLYATVDEKQHHDYVTKFSQRNVVETGREYCQKIIAKNDIFLPDKKTMEKIELNLLKDKDVQKELVTSLMNKGMSREAATEQVRPYSTGKAFIQKSMDVVSGLGVTALGGASTALGISTGHVPLIGTGAIAAGNGLVLTGKGLASESKERKRALNATRTSYGDKNNKITNAKLKEELQKQGYNAMKDYNDRRAFGKDADSAVIVFDSKKNLKSGNSTRITAKQYGEMYADRMMELHKKSGYKNTINREDYVKDGIKEFQDYEKQHIISEGKKADEKRYLEAAKKKK